MTKNDSLLSKAVVFFVAYTTLFDAMQSGRALHFCVKTYFALHSLNGQAKNRLCAIWFQVILVSEPIFLTIPYRAKTPNPLK